MRALGKAGPLWHDKERSRLWLYHLHYLDDLDAVDVESNRATALRLINSWITHNPPAFEAGWEPYPLSIRIVNIVKFLASNTSEVPGHILFSLATQVTSLERQIEYHLRANHLFENGKALLFAGCFFSGPRAESWLRKGLEILDAECREQFLSDGAHFELSPMYHGVMLWSLCDLISLSHATGIKELTERRPTWGRLVQLGLEWYRAMTHPDGEIAFFNDAALGHAPNFECVNRYARSLDLDVAAQATSTFWPALTELSASGYLRVDYGSGSTCILDIAQVGPAYQPGHAHSDTLSFEMSLFGQRVFVNSGTSTYERGQERDTQRGTAAHNTVIVDGRNSSDTWAGFRVGRRAVPKITSIERGPVCVSISAEHDGYRRLFGGATHQRKWTCARNRLSVHDRLAGRFAFAYAHYHLHPNVEVCVDQHDADRIAIRLPRGQVVSLWVPKGRLTLLSSFWHSQFGCTIPNRCLRIEFTGLETELQIFWPEPA